MSIYKQITSELTRTPNNLKNFLQYPQDEINKGVRGWVGDRAKNLGYLKSDDNLEKVTDPSPNLESGGELDPDELSGPNQAWRKKKFGRLAHNLNRRDASILTEG